MLVTPLGCPLSTVAASVTLLLSPSAGKCHTRTCCVRGRGKKLFDAVG